MITDRRVLSDRYEILDFVGEGGMASVYRGRDRILQRVVAIKILSSNLAADPGAVERFRREAQAAAGLNDPGIVAVYDTGADGGLHYIVMEYVEGRTLDEVLREEGRLVPERALEIAERVSAALTAAHVHGVIHRDVKPGNILIGPNDSMKVMDFGIARAAQFDTGAQTAAILGTASYLSPEQAKGDRVDARSDVYSLGVVLYEMLAGRPPFTGETPVAIAAKHVHEQPVPPSRIDPALGPAYDTVLLRALAKSPEDRYPSAEAFAADLRRLRSGGSHPLAGSAAPTQAIPASTTRVLEPVPPSYAGAHRKSRWPALAALIAALLVLAVVLALVFAGLEGGRQTAELPTSPSATPPTTAPGTTQPPQQSMTVGQAAAALAAVVTEGVEGGEITPRGRNEILRGEAKALREFQDGDVDKAMEELDDLDDTVDELAEKGEISSEDRVSALHDAIDDLRTAMESA